VLYGRNFIGYLSICTDNGQLIRVIILLLFSTFMWLTQPRDIVIDICNSCSQCNVTHRPHFGSRPNDSVKVPGTDEEKQQQSRNINAMTIC